MIRRVLQWLFPEKCVLCRSFLGKEETDLCRKCRVDQPASVTQETKIRKVREKAV